MVFHYSWGDVNKYLLTAHRKAKPEQDKDTTKVQLGEGLSCVGVTWRNIGGVFTQSRNGSKTATKVYPRTGDTSGKLGNHKGTG